MRVEVVLIDPQDLSREFIQHLLEIDFALCVLLLASRDLTRCHAHLVGSLQIGYVLGALGDLLLERYLVLQVHVSVLA